MCQVKPNSLDVTPKSLILHPNIDKGKLCMIFDDAKEAPTLEASILAILYLLHNPDYFGASFEFRKCVPEYDGYRWIRLSLTGRQIVNFKGLKYIEDDQEITEILDDIEVYRLSKLNFAGIVEDEELEAFCEERKNKRAKNCENIVKTPHISPTTVEGKSGALSELEEIIYKKLEQYNDITEKYHDPTAVMSFYSFKQPITEQTFQPPDSYSESNVQNMARHSCRQEISSCKLQDL